MRLEIRDAKKVLAGAIFLGAGLFLSAQLANYRLGTATHMGPGYFLLILAIFLLLLGAASIGQGLTAATRVAVERPPWAPMIFITAGVVGFGLLIERLGLAAALLCLTIFASYRRLRHNYVEVAVTYLFLAVLTGLLFVVMLGLPLSIF